MKLKKLIEMKLIKWFLKRDFIIPELQQVMIKGGGDPKPRVTRVVIVKKPD